MGEAVVALKRGRELRWILSCSPLGCCWLFAARQSVFLRLEAGRRRIIFSRQIQKICYVRAFRVAMSFKSSLILTAVIGLFFSTQVFPVTSPMEMTKGDCAKMVCAMGCCANKACCAAMEQHRTTQPIHGASRLDLSLAVVKLRDFAPLYFLPPVLRSFAFRDDAHAGHTPPLLAVTCIRLI